jgi:hypothetical protein
MSPLTKKSLVVFGSIGAILLGSSEPQAIAEEKPIIYTQTLKTGNWNILERASAFNRMNVEIITTKPWINPENRKFRFSNAQITNILQKAGFSGRELKIAQRIVFLESTNRPYALNKSSNCYGLFQINMTGAMGTDRREKYGLERNEDLFDPLTNAKIAYHMSNGGKDWSAWTTAKAAKS